MVAIKTVFPMGFKEYNNVWTTNFKPGARRIILKIEECEKFLVTSAKFNNFSNGYFLPNPGQELLTLKSKIETTSKVI